MEPKEEYHDPDYPEASTSVVREAPSLSEEDKIEKIKHIVCREFTNELDVRENEVLQLDQRLTHARRLLHRLRYASVATYYGAPRLQLPPEIVGDQIAAQIEPRARSEVAAVLRDGQRRIHPSVRKLLGKSAVDLDEILYRSRAPRINARKDYLAMVKTRNYTIPADSTKTMRSEPEVLEEPPEECKPKKVPKHLQPKIVNVVTLDEATRNQMKYRYRIIIGNTSKYAPAASQADRSTHKWLLYVRGPARRPDLAAVVTAVTVRLHHSYAPHHAVTMDKPPYHVSRRGWGEFPARVELHFPLPARNRPAAVTHTVRLDRHRTGLQTLGAETIVDVWLYSTPEMLEYEFKEDIYTDTQNENITEANTEDTNTNEETAIENEEKDTTQNDSWLEFFANTTELDVDEMIIKPEKKVEEAIEENIDGAVEENLENDVGTTLVANNDFSLGVKELEEANQVFYKSLELQEDLPNELLAQPTSPRKRIMKYMDPTTGKIYYLEMDRKLDLTKVQEIVINSKGNVQTAKISPIKPNGLKNVRRNIKSGGMSLLKPEVKNQLRNEISPVKTVEDCSTMRTLAHIENDHCYLGSNVNNKYSEESVYSEKLDVKFNTEEIPLFNGVQKSVKKEKSVLDCLCSNINRFSSVKIAVNYLLKNIPVISSQARDPDFVRDFPFVVETEERYWKLDFAKRRNIEWSRAKLINKLLTDPRFANLCEPVWRTKQILIYSRMHAFHPVRPETSQVSQMDNQDWSSWLDLENSRKLSMDVSDFCTDRDVNTLSIFDSTEFMNLSDTLEMSESDEEIEIVNEVTVNVKSEQKDSCSSALTVLPVVNEDDRQRFLFVERKCADIGIELRNEDVGHGYSYSLVHAVLVSAMRSFAEELVRGAAAARAAKDRVPGLQVWCGPPSRLPLPPPALAAAARGRLRLLTRRSLATEEKPSQAL